MTAYHLLVIVGLVLVLVVANGAAFALFALDKHRAETGGWRVAEATLLMVALLGGSIGAKVAQRRFRHKTRKEPFRTQLNVICVIQAVAVSSLVLVPGPRAQALAAFDSMADGFPRIAPATAAMPVRFGPGS